MKCLVFDCVNHDDQGRFEGPLCSPCAQLIKTGRVGWGENFINRAIKGHDTTFSRGFELGYAKAQADVRKALGVKG